MQIKKLQFEEKINGWTLNETYFNSLTLLFGNNGVGKTKIFNCIKTLKKIVNGKSFNGIKWEIKLYDNEIGNIKWLGETDISKDVFDSNQFPINIINNKKANFNFIKEELFINDNKLSSRKNEVIYYKDYKELKLTQEKSLLNILEEDEILKIRNKFKINCNFIHEIDKPISTKTKLFLKEINNFNDLKNNINIDIPEKLYLSFGHFENIFKKIKRNFISLFPFIEDIRFERINELSEGIENYEVIQFREKFSPNWINGWHFSKGMMKVLSILTYFELSPKNSIFLIDEFENSLGSDILNNLLSLIACKIHDNQIILSSQNQLVSENISVDSLKKVSRNKNIVTVSSI